MRKNLFLIFLALAHAVLNKASVEAATTNSISPGQITNGSITLLAPTNFFSFTAASNDVISIILLKTNGLARPYLFLYDPQGYYVGESNSDGTQLFVPYWRLATTGRYTIHVIDGASTDTYDYRLNVIKVFGEGNQREAGDGAEAIAPGQITSGRIALADMDTYTFNAASNDVISVALLKTNGSARPYLYLFDPEGNNVAENNSDGTMLFVHYLRLAKTGSYTFLVLDGARTDTFDYLLSLTKVFGGGNQREVGDGAEAIVPGQISRGRITAADMDTFTFTAVSNDVISAALVKTNGSAKPYLFLFDPKGNYVSEWDTAPTWPFVAGLRLNKTGQYTFLVIDGNVTDIYDYTFCMLKIPGPNSPEPSEGTEFLHAGEIRAAEIVPGDLDAFAFEVIAGDTAFLTLTQISGDGQISASIYGPDGNVLATANSAAQTLRFPCSTNTGIYFITIRDVALDQSFGYNLTLWQNPGPPLSYDPAHPYLAIFRCTTNTVVRWPTNAAGFQLKYRTNAVSGAWSNLSPPYAIIANHFYVTNRSADSMRIYRLQK